MNLTTKYLGLTLKNPLLPAAGPLAESVSTVRELEDAGASAVVLHSLFEEQIRHEAVVEQLTESAASTQGRVYCGEELVGEVDIVFSHIDQNISGLDFPEDNFVFTEEFMSLLKMYRGHGAERVKL